MHKICASKKNGTPLQGWFFDSSQMKSQRFISKNKNKIYWFFVPNKDQYFFFLIFNVKIWVLFFKNRKKSSWIYTRKKIQKLLNFFVKKWRNLARKKDTGKDLEWSFKGIQVQCSAVHY
jgi:hypothetical protein